MRARLCHPRLRQCGPVHCDEIGIGQPHRGASPEGRQTVVNDQSAAGRGHLRLDQPDDPRIEAHEAITAAVAREGLPKGRCQSEDVSVDLDLEQQRDPSRDKLKKARQRRDTTICDPQGGNVSERGTADPVRAAAQAHGVVVMKNDDMRIGRHPKVAFDSGTGSERRFERGDAVLGNLESGVKAAMGEARRAGIERVSP